ncbi:MAG: hypothetical protein ACODAG_12065 [Myxococcota bacterium]
MARQITIDDQALELFENLRAICADCPEFPHSGADIEQEEAGYEGRDHYERLMRAGFEMDFECGSDRLA